MLTGLMPFGRTGTAVKSAMRKRLRLGSKRQHNTGLPSPHTHHLRSRLRTGDRQRPAAFLGDLRGTPTIVGWSLTEHTGNNLLDAQKRDVLANLLGLRPVKSECELEAEVRIGAAALPTVLPAGSADAYIVVAGA
jgi:hypothetical protein